MRKLLVCLVVGLEAILAGCHGLVTSLPATPPPGQTTAVNHIVYMMQENRSFDHYFGQLNNYRQSKGLHPDVDVTPANASQLSFDGTTSFTPFHMSSKCVEDLSSYWNESHN